MAQLWQHKYQRKPGRWVFVPTDECRTQGEVIRADLAKVWKPPSNYFHLKAGGHVAALRSHTKHKCFVRLDIEDFFGSVSLTRVTRCLVPLFGYAGARRMARASTVNHPVERGRTMLPYGYVQSPLLASLALSESALGKRLAAMAQWLTVSVYVDDIILSGNDEAAVGQARAELEALAPISRFTFGADKCQGPADVITAFNVQLQHDKLAVTRSRLREFAEVLANDPSEHERAGILSYVRSVNVDQADQLAA